ncbi:MAG: efflux RND transporter periplasmic adaptor subunit [Paludibacter sp.]|nr:efflux RND transporter periplasmic adaptor subunit [Bacteroidales bacterium]MCM1069247.1 efflux RND transporter periplasmic adaptor subunit [Prevotella sp.]MCM1354333.1 efflux RND transporter periplasmic adaptor subunit [Bacteroides sp.]MCM1443207.1 efflux RND transporter periplasmic adaptor subunit [Muribaculum sp.]MCM1481802.1 efflux RND transporter periplasmic adaptor subunit [Paludibacter sp.]
MKKNIIYALALVLLASCGNKQTDTTATQEERTEQVKTTILHPQEIQREITLSTNLQPYQYVNVAPSLTGLIEHIYVEVGDKKQKGDMLVRMDQTQYKTSKLALSNLQVEIGRMEALLKTGSVSQQAYDQAKLSYDQTKENLDFLETNTYVKAPFAGVISAKNYEDGELYGGQPILVLSQINKLKALVAIPETYFPFIKAGMKVDLRSDIYPEQVFPATIEVVYPTIDAVSHTFQVKLQIPNQKELLRPGMYVSTRFGLGKAETIVVPYQSVEKLVGANDRYVFLNENGYAKRVAVTLGQRFDQDVEIISPEITEGVEMVTVGQHKLVDGVKLNVVE